MPATAPVNIIAFVVEPLHNVWLLTVLTEGVGLTVIVKLVAPPGQPLAEVFTVIVAVMGELPLLTAVNELISPVPEAAKPILVLLFDHE